MKTIILILFFFFFGSVNFNSVYASESTDQFKSISQSTYLKLLKIQFDRDFNNPELLKELQGSNPKSALIAVKIVGSIGSSYALPETLLNALTKLLQSKNANIRGQAAYALAMYSSPTDIQKENFRQKIAEIEKNELNPSTRALQLIALGAIGNDNDFKTLISVAKKSKNIHIKAGALIGIYNVVWNVAVSGKTLTADDELLVQLSDWTINSNAPESEIAAQVIYVFSLADKNIHTRPVAKKIVEAAKKAKLDLSKNWIVLSISSKFPDVTEAFISAAKDPNQKVRANYAAFASSGTEDKTDRIKLLLSLLSDKSSFVRYSSALGLNFLLEKKEVKSKLIEHFSDLRTIYDSINEPGTKELLLDLLLSLDPDKTEPLLRTELLSKNIQVRGKAIQNLGQLKKSSDNLLFINSIEDSNPFISASGLQAVLKFGESNLNEDIQNSICKKISSGSLEALSKIEAFSKWKNLSCLDSSLIDAYEKIKNTTYNTQMVSIMNAFTTRESKITLSTVKEALNSPYPDVVKAAKKAYVKITNTEISVSENKVPPVTMTFPSYSEIQDSISAKYIIKTQKGEFKIKMNPETPLSAVAFARLVQNKNYSHSLVDWVWPSFIVSFGDHAQGLGLDYGSFTFPTEVVDPFQLTAGALTFTADTPDSNRGAILASCNFRFYDAHQITTKTPFAYVTEGFENLETSDLYGEILSIEKL